MAGPDAGMVVAALLALWPCSVIHAQPRSRLDVELGTMLAGNGKAVVIVGATRWTSGDYGVALRGHLSPWLQERLPPDQDTLHLGGVYYRGVDFMLRRRGFSENFHTDVGIGLLFGSGQSVTLRRAQDAVEELRGGRSRERGVLVADLRVGRRLLERFGLKGGVRLLLGVEAVGVVAEGLVVVPLGRR